MVISREELYKEMGEQNMSKETTPLEVEHDHEGQPKADDNTDSTHKDKGFPEKTVDKSVTCLDTIKECDKGPHANLLVEAVHATNGTDTDNAELLMQLDNHNKNPIVFTDESGQQQSCRLVTVVERNEAGLSTFQWRWDPKATSCGTPERPMKEALIASVSGNSTANTPRPKGKKRRQILKPRVLVFPPEKKKRSGEK